LLGAGRVGRDPYPLEEKLGGDALCRRTSTAMRSAWQTRHELLNLDWEKFLWCLAELNVPFTQTDVGRLFGGNREARRCFRLFTMCGNFL